MESHGDRVRLAARPETDREEEVKGEDGEDEEEEEESEEEDERHGLGDPLWYINVRESLHVIIPVIFAALLTAYGVYPPNQVEIHELDCRPDLASDDPKKPAQCYHKCENGTFTLPGLEGCQPYLSCADIDKIEIDDLIGEGAVKSVFMGDWKGYFVAVNKLANEEYREDFRHGLNMLIGLQRHPRVVQLLGWCGDTFVTEYHRLGSGVNYESILGLKSLNHYNNLTTRFTWCLHYAESIKYLHESPLGVRVMCDTNDIQKTLSQYLLTFDLQLILNDLDALPQVLPGKGVKCGHRQLFGDFVAPEQLWPYEGKKFSDAKMPPYTEKIDIWKIPDVCLNFIGHDRGSDVLKFHLHKVHQNCKNEDPRVRPTSNEIVREYERVRKYISLHSYKET